ncbi:hypothetical protein ACFQYP_32000 [Nonomuraea antimicrobica]
MDTGFDSGTSSLTVANPASGGTQQIVSVGGDNAVELRDAAQGTNLSSYFSRRWSSGALKDRINAVYALPVGSPPSSSRCATNSSGARPAPSPSPRTSTRRSSSATSTTTWCPGSPSRR